MKNDGTLLYLSYNWRGLNYGVRTSFDIGVDGGICSGVLNDIGGKFESGNDGYFVSEVGGEVFPRYVISVGKYVKGWFNVIIYDSAGWGIAICVGTAFLRGVDDEVNL